MDLGVTKLITLSEETLPTQMSFLSRIGLKHEIHGCVEFEGIPVAKIVKIIDSIGNEIKSGVKLLFTVELEMEEQELCWLLLS